MKTLILLTVMLMRCFAVLAQHEHYTPAKDTTKPSTKDTAKQKTEVQDTTQHNHSTMQHHMNDSMQMDMDMNGEENDHGSMNMPHSFSRNLPMSRNGSGTAWLPDNSPMFAYMYHSKNWMYMLHGDIYVRYNKQDLFDKGSRGGEKFDAPNMVMFMGQRNVGQRGLFHFNTMFSLDPFTIGAGGYPLLFQTGESYKGKPLVDRQHPHDLFSELSISYAYALSFKSDVFIYLGYPGEPAIGPVAYVHRPSGFFNPDAPLTHHWADATHITFGVATLGFRYNNFKIEGSAFTGREPDEHRYNFDKPRFDSWSGRLSYNPTAKWALQVSHAFLNSPEDLHPGEDVNRTTASATYSTKNMGDRFTNITVLWGMNKTPGHGAEQGLLLEGTRNIKKLAIYGRYEWVQKSVEELKLNEAIYGHDATFPVHAITTGASYDVLSIGNTKFALGGQLSLYNSDNRLNNLYGSTPMAGQVYLRIYPKAVRM